MTATNPPGRAEPRHALRRTAAAARPVFAIVAALVALAATSAAGAPPPPGAPTPVPPTTGTPTTGTPTTGTPTTGTPMSQQPTKYVRYSGGGRTSYGILEGDTIHQLDGDLFAAPRRSGTSVALADVRLLAPCEPSKVIAVGLNYRSHIGERPAAAYPGLFAKYPTSIVGPGAAIVIPPDAHNVHYEGELVVVIGKEAKNISAADARQYVFGVTAGNDVSERDWQSADLQWLRAKGTDTFGPIGPVIVAGLDYNDLHVETRLNGEVRQAASTKDLIFGVDEVISYISRYVTLYPGDLIFTGTPGTTQAMKPGDIVEIEVEGVGVLSNPVTAAR